VLDASGAFHSRLWIITERVRYRFAGHLKSKIPHFLERECNELKLFAIFDTTAKLVKSSEKTLIFRCSADRFPSWMSRVRVSSPALEFVKGSLAKTSARSSRRGSPIFPPIAGVAG
jgi:hypothetical protein